MPSVPEFVVPGAGPAPVVPPSLIPVVPPDPGPASVSPGAGIDGTLEIDPTAEPESSEAWGSALDIVPQEPEPQEDSASALVSTPLEPDITAAVEPLLEMPLEDAEESPAPNVDTSAPVVEVNLPVVSPSTSESGAVSPTQGSEGAGPRGEIVTPPSNGAASPWGTAPISSAPPTSGDRGVSVSELAPPRYQGQNLQYQSEEQSGSEAWNWSWNLQIDCAGNVISESTHTGAQPSLIWAWDWIWNWSCADGNGNALPTSPDSIEPSVVSDGDNTNVTVRAFSPGEDGSVTQSTATAGPTEGTTPSTGLWAWNWTFTFCGETRSFSTELDSQTPLTWTWNWIWNWTCGGTPVANAPELDDATPASDAMPVPPSSPVISEVPATQMPVLAPRWRVDVPLLGWPPFVVGVDVAVIVDPAFPIPALLENELPTPVVPGVDVSVVIVPADTARVTGLANGLNREGPREAPGLGTNTRRLASGQLGAESNAPRQATTAIARPRVESVPRPQSSKPARKTPSARSASSPRGHAPLGPFGQPRSSQGAGSSASGGRVPSAPVAAVAALIAFFILAAPRVGRRIRVARELSPRSAYRSSIDHPG